ncbi:uncharacterized protein LOC110752368 [Prunus avium]|uniref:Uncharacterized protein LOC110752368 n=1 Tax=Prunus avium TaxID=42229 RepID=A0A6P5S5B3_PRUAV|nr:uncharacterized protein LOC110752368 [Prunus avium]
MYEYSNIVSTALSCASTSLKMPSVFHVPKLSANLLSVNQLCKDNHCIISFDSAGFCIQDKTTKDKITKVILLKGSSCNGLYPIPCKVPYARFSFSSPTAYLGQRLTCPYTPQQNGMAERKNRHVVETDLTLLTAANMPGQFCHWQVFDIVTDKFVISRHVIHDESIWPFKSLRLRSMSASVSEPPVAMPPIFFPLPLQEDSPHATTVAPPASSTLSSSEIFSSSTFASPFEQQLSGSESVLVPEVHHPLLGDPHLLVLPPLEHSSSGTSSSDSLPIFPINTHPMHTRLRDGIVQKKQFLDYVGYYTCLNARIELDELVNHKLRQLVIKNAFLHGELEEEVFMRQLHGFADPRYSDFVCKLKKSLYDLRQAPRAWNAKFTGYLPAIGFQASQSDPSLFVKHSDSEVVILLLYVDDIILTGSNEKMVQLVIDE